MSRRQKNKKYSAELKLKAVQDYLKGGGRPSSSGKQDIAGKDKGSGNGDSAAKKIEETERGRSLSGVLQEDRYIAIQYLNKTENYPIEKLCAKLHICRSAYYKWLKRTPKKAGR